MTDGRAGEGPSPFVLDFDHAEIEEGPMGYMIEDRHLRRALLDAMAAEPRVTQIQAKRSSRSHRADDGVSVDARSRTAGP